MLVVAAIEQAIDSTTDQAHEVAKRANAVMVFGEHDGLLAGPRSPKFESDVRGR